MSINLQGRKLVPSAYLHLNWLIKNKETYLYKADDPILVGQHKFVSDVISQV